MLVEEMNPVMQNSFKRALVHAKLSAVLVFFQTVQHVQSPISSSISKGQKVSCTYSKLEEGFISSYFLSVFFLRYSDASVLGDLASPGSEQAVFGFSKQICIQMLFLRSKGWFDCVPVALVYSSDIEPSPESQEPINRLLSLYNVKDES